MIVAQLITLPLTTQPPYFSLFLWCRGEAGISSDWIDRAKISSLWFNCRYGCIRSETRAKVAPSRVDTTVATILDPRTARLTVASLPREYNPCGPSHARGALSFQRKRFPQTAKSGVLSNPHGRATARASMSNSRVSWNFARFPKGSKSIYTPIATAKERGVLSSSIQTYGLLLEW